MTGDEVKLTCGNGPIILLKMAFVMAAPIGNPVTIKMKPAISCCHRIADVYPHHGWRSTGHPPSQSKLFGYLFQHF